MGEETEKNGRMGREARSCAVVQHASSPLLTSRSTAALFKLLAPELLSDLRKPLLTNGAFLVEFPE